MSTLAVAKKDFRGTRRTKTLWAVAGILSLLGGGLAYTGSTSTGDIPPTASMLHSLMLLTAILLPIVTIVATYLSIAGEREGGGIKFLLALPNTRRDVFLGKFLSRGAAVGGCVLAMFALVLALSLWRFESPSLAVVLGLAGLTLVYALVFVALSVGLSAAVASRTRAIAGAIGAYFATVVVYFVPVINVVDLVAYLNQDLLGRPGSVDLRNAVEHTSPFVAYQHAANLVFPEQLQDGRFVESATNADSLQGLLQDPTLPWYLTAEFSLVILAAWIVVPLAVGYWRFERADV